MPKSWKPSECSSILAENAPSGLDAEGARKWAEQRDARYQQCVAQQWAALAPWKARVIRIVGRIIDLIPTTPPPPGPRVENDLRSPRPEEKTATRPEEPPRKESVPASRPI